MKIALTLFVLAVTEGAAKRPVRRAAPSVDLSHATAIHDVSVVDVETGTIEAHRNVSVRGEKIVAVGAAVKPGAGERVVDGAGKFLIPGLWDMHVHLWGAEPRFGEYLASGVTGVRDMGSNFARVKEWRGKIERGAMHGPRIFTSGPPIDGPDEIPDERLSARMVRNAAEARLEFDRLDDLHVDFIEVLPGLRADAYFALTEFSRHWGHRIAGDLPDGVSAFQAVDARQGSIEGLAGLYLSCSSDERELRRQWRDARKAGDAAAMEKVLTAAGESYSKRRAAVLFSNMKVYEVLDTPMLRAGDAARYGAMLKEMSEAGVRFLVGTDAGMPDIAAGSALHDQMEAMVEAGLTAAQVLRAATYYPGHALRQEANVGSVRAGRFADLVLLEENPLTDIANTRKVAGVFANGRYLSKSELAARMSK